MAFWIVYQGNSWDRARRGGYLWAPKLGRDGKPREYWTTMERVAPGDLIFSGVSNGLRAVAEATSSAHSAARPDPLDAGFWQGDGWRLDVAYTDLAQPLMYADWVPTILRELPALHSPFYGVGKPNQGYLYSLPNSVGEYVISLARENGTDIVGDAARAVPTSAAPETVRQQLAAARIGQGAFRKSLLDRWNSTCAVSGLDRLELLRASHIKPWASSNNAERLDPANGLLLSARYDAAFDAKLISFADDGTLLLASDFPRHTAASAGIDTNAKIAILDSSTKRYLAVHRQLMATRAARALSLGNRIATTL